MSRLLLIGVAVAMMSGVWATDAVAQRDAGAKARGEFGTGFWNPKYRRSPGRSYSYRPAQPSRESYRSFSYEPIGINSGDTVAVQGDNVKLMKGTEVVGDAPNGLRFQVTKVINGWLGAVVEVDGEQLRGWIWHKNVALEETAAGESSHVARGDTQSEGYRRFSYEPSQGSLFGQGQGILGRLFSGSSSGQSTSSRGRTKPPWAYPKTDPRRYRR